MKRIVVLVNKDFEYAGFIEGLRDTVQAYAGTNGRDAECRFDNLIADIYCIQNLFKEGENSSNSEMKYGYLKDLFKRNAFRLDECSGILSFSTSESTPHSQTGLNCKYEYDDTSVNGCVYVGNRFFLSDQGKNDPTTDSHLVLDHANEIEYFNESPLCKGFYDILNLTKMKFKPAYRNTAHNLRCYAGNHFTCVGVVNVMNYACYEKADKAAYDLFTNTFDDFPSGIETTHGVVVKALHDAIGELEVKENEIPKKIDIPVNFVSPIVDRYLKFDEDVDGKYGKQNYICSYNGGVAVGHMLKILNDNM